VKHKKNTRRRHNPRNKTRKPRNTHKKYNRCRTRRGGWITKADVFGIVLSERLDAYKEAIPTVFGSYETFLHFLKAYTVLELQTVVCGDNSEEVIRLNQTKKLLDIKQILENLKKSQKLNAVQDRVLALLNNPSFMKKWTEDFVISLKKSVDARYAQISAKEMSIRSELLNL
jgi:hypothetical protein